LANQCLKLLVVDDEPDVELLFRQRFRRVIRKGEVELKFAREGEEALRILEENPDIRIVLSDINMPRMNGLQLLHHVRRLDRVIEVIIVSAYGDLGNIRTAMNRGAYDFLTKPLDFADLDATILKTQQHVTELLDAIEVRQQAKELSKSNAFIRQTFGRYVSEDVVTELLDHPEGLALGGERRALTILSSDLRGFTALSERMPPESVVNLLNQYLEAMFRVILEHRGTINAILGDGLFVLFGAPIKQPDSAQRAISCALHMQLALEHLRQQPGFLEPDLEMGIGLHSGQAVVGNIGSQQRSHYSAIGSDVNLAARVEASTVGGQILITDDTLAAAGVDVELRCSFEVLPKGVAESIAVHEVVAIDGPHAVRWDRPTEAPTTLDTPLAVRFRVLDGKSAQSERHSGSLVAVSRQRAVLVVDVLPEALSDLRIELRDPPSESAMNDVYAKVLAGQRPTDDSVLLGFTAVPPAVAAALAAARGR
jgi:adenylate cyclase